MEIYSFLSLNKIPIQGVFLSIYHLFRCSVIYWNRYYFLYSVEKILCIDAMATCFYAVIKCSRSGSQVDLRPLTLWEWLINQRHYIFKFCMNFRVPFSAVKKKQSRKFNKNHHLLVQKIFYNVLPGKTWNSSLKYSHVQIRT